MPKNILFVINTLSRAGAETALLELLPCFFGPEWKVDLYVILEQGELVDLVPRHVTLLNKRFSKESVLTGRGRVRMFFTVCRALISRGTMFRLFPYLVSSAFRMLRRGGLKVDKLCWRVLSDGAPRFSKEYDLAVAYIEGGSSYYVADHVNAKKKAAFIHVDYGMSGYDRKLDKDCFLKMDHVFPISEETQKSFLEAYPECEGKTSTFHNIVNQEVIREKAMLPGGFTDEYDGARILTVARLTKQKAFPTAIDAMKLLKDAGVKARWYVLGEGDERGRLEQKIRQLGLEKEFILLGAVGNPYPYYVQADLYVHATAYEGKSIAIQEAQTLACPIITSDIISNRQQVEDGVDGLVIAQKPEALAKAIQELLNDHEKARRLGKNAAKRKFSYEKDLEGLFSLTSSRE